MANQVNNTNTTIDINAMNNEQLIALVQQINTVVQGRVAQAQQPQIQQPMYTQQPMGFVPFQQQPMQPVAPQGIDPNMMIRIQQLDAAIQQLLMQGNQKAAMGMDTRYEQTMINMYKNELMMLTGGTWTGTIATAIGGGVTNTANVLASTIDVLAQAANALLQVAGQAVVGVGTVGANAVQQVGVTVGSAIAGEQK